MQLWGTLILFSVLSLKLAESQNTSCGNDFKTLEKALLQTGNNTLKLLQAFYPPRQPPATFVTVHYTFLDADGNISCNKTWFWSSVECYLIQSPTIFLYTSLFFTIPLDRTTTVNIIFKDNCRDLVTWNEKGTCTCTSNSLLDILTQRLKSYAMNSNPDDIQIDDISLGTAVCEDDREKEYHHKARVFFVSCELFIPLCVLVLLVITISSTYSKLSSAIVVLDIVALVCASQGNLEFSSRSNIGLSAMRTVLDTVAVVITYITLPLYFLLPKHFPKKCLKCCKKLPECCKPTCKGLKHKNTTTTLTIASMCFAPLFCLASHSRYIIVAWLSDTQHAGPATFFYIISFLYCFIIFRQLYKLCNKACFCLFILKFLFGGILIGAEIFVICSLTILPITVTTAPTVGPLASFPGQTRSGNEANVFHLAFLIITGFFTYKFIYTEDEPKQFMNTLVTYLRNKGLDLRDLQGTEAAGEITGRVVYTIIQKENTRYLETLA